MFSGLAARDPPATNGAAVSSVGVFGGARSDKECVLVSSICGRLGTGGCSELEGTALGLVGGELKLLGLDWRELLPPLPPELDFFIPTEANGMSNAATGDEP